MSKLTDNRLKEMGFTKYMVGDLTYFFHQKEDVKLEKIHNNMYLNPRKHKIIKTIEDLMKLFVFLFIVSFSFGQTTIIEDNQTAEHSPIEPYWSWTYSQQIYLQSEIYNSGDIYSLSFKYNGWSSFSDSVEVYLGHTSKDKFNNRNDWVDVSQLTKVFDGIYSVDNIEDWYEIEFDIPFSYNNTDNLVIAVFEKTDGYHSPSDEFYTADAVTYRVLTYYNDYTKPDPVSPPQATYRSRWIPSLKLDIVNPLPVTSFDLSSDCDGVKLSWDYSPGFFTIHRFVNEWEELSTVSGNEFLDRDFVDGVSYYKISFEDIDGNVTESKVLSSEIYCNDEIYKVYDFLGREVDINFRGQRIIFFKSGKIIKKFF